MIVWAKLSLIPVRGKHLDDLSQVRQPTGIIFDILTHVYSNLSFSFSFPQQDIFAFYLINRKTISTLVLIKQQLHLSFTSSSVICIMNLIVYGTCHILPYQIHFSLFLFFSLCMTSSTPYFTGLFILNACMVIFIYIITTNWHLVGQMWMQ